jgi:thiosulfate/3-mercaptopyruvate sulfurtransferase
MIENFTAVISPARLAESLGGNGWVVVDCRFDLGASEKGLQAFRTSHVPGAVYAHLDRDLSGAIGGNTGRHPLPDAGRFMQWLGRQGIGNDSQVVAYDDTGGSMASRLWWLLRWLGHERVAVLDGGWQAWTKAGLPVTAQSRPPRPTEFCGGPDMSGIVTTQALLLPEPRRLIVDVRAAERFRGEREPIDPVAGHIPGAVNLPLQRHLVPDGRFLPAADLRALYLPMVTDRQPADLVFMCGSGVTACHGILAMQRAGLPGARLYAGSWSEWIRDAARPVARGPA